MSDKIKIKEKYSFLIVWHDLGVWEWIEDYSENPHDYAWNSDKYGTSKYFIVECKEPELFSVTPEDELLDRIFKET